MDVLLQNLEEILSNEAQLHQELLSLLEEEAISIGQVAPSALLHLQSLKQHVSHKIIGLEKRRTQVVEELAQAWNVDFAELTLSQIIQRAPQEMRQPLQQCFDQLKKLIQEIRQLAHKNGALSETRLKPIEMSLRFIHDWQKKQRTYSIAGTLTSAPEKVARRAI